MSSDELLSAVLALPRAERAKLAQDLLRSLDESQDADLDAAWAVEIARRAREISSGTVEPVDLEVARERIANRLKARRAQR
ncbi:MAG: addiction module protein [Polyangiaceae bacterium]|nr:addiction module protein [Polyangiaceae bacterium]